MSDTTNALLQQAYTLIENDELDKAQEILAPVLEGEANNVHLWWVYSHAVRDTAMGQAALERVLELDPQYPGARELKADVLEAQAKDPDLIALAGAESSAAQTATELEIDDWENLQPVADLDAAGSRSRSRFIFLLLLLIIVAGGALVISGAVDISALLSGLLPSPEPKVIVVSAPTVEPTETEDVSGGVATAEEPVATSEPTVAASTEIETEIPPEATAIATTEDDVEPPIAEVTPVATTPVEKDPTPVAVSSEVSAFVRLVAAAIEEFAVDRSHSATRSTNLGNTLVIQVCAVPGPEFNARLSMVMNAIAAEAEDIPDAVEAVAAGLLNCDDPDARLRIIGVARSVISDFANEAIQAKDFQRAWQPLS